MASSLNGTGITFSDSTSQASAINTVNGKSPSSGQIQGVIVSGTAVASTSGTSIDFTSIPSWVKRITVMFSGVSTNGTSNRLVQIGAGSVTTTGYVSTAGLNSTSTVSSTAGFIIWDDSAAFTLSGQMVLTTLGSNVWVSSHTGKVNTNQVAYGGGDVTLGGALNRIRITTVNGTDTFDAGSISILYE